jgi:hypothetical protein
MCALVAGSSASRDPRPLEPFELSCGLLGGGAATFVLAAIADFTTDCIWFDLPRCWPPSEASDWFIGSFVEEPAPPWRTLRDLASTTE